MLPGPAPGAATAEYLQQLVSPIALYPDLLVAQILAASTYPAQVAEANHWLEQNPNLKGDALAAKVNSQEWDPSIKSLTQFPPVLKTMNDNLAWTTALGEAYFNQPADVMNAIQELRNRAMDAGTLKTTSEQTVTVESAEPSESTGGQSQQTVIIKPADPTIVYVPQYNPQTVYGAPVGAVPGYAAPTPAPGYTGAEMLTVGLLSFGLGMLLATAINDSHNDWNCNWHGGSVTYNRNVYVSRTNNIVGPRYRPETYPRSPYAGGNPRPMPYPASRPLYEGTRPYNQARAREYAANNPSFVTPTFPKPSELANKLPNQSLVRKVPARTPPNKEIAVGQPLSLKQPAKRSDNRQPARAPDSPSLRGYQKDSGSAGRRNLALGGYEPGGLEQQASARGRASLGRNGGPGRGNGNSSGADNKAGNRARSGGNGKRSRD
jgi:hypothetical protein